MKKRSKRTKIIALAAIVLLSAGGAGAYWLANRNNTKGEYFVNYDAPTEEEKTAGDKQKDEVIKRDDMEDQYNNANNGSSGEKRVAEIVKSNAGQYDDVVEVRAYVANILEDGGVCTATFTNGSATVSSTSQAFKDARTTQCGQLDTQRSKFNSTGTWNLRIMYESAAARGSIDAGTVTIK